MDQAKKQRLVGTVVLIALAVILIPMILDFSNTGIDRTKNLQAPKAPDVNTMQVLPLDVWSQKRDPKMDTQAVYVEPDIEKDSAETKVVPMEEAEPKQSTPVVEPVVDVEAVAQAKVDESMAGRAWVVQMVSVSKRQNALAFRQKLDALGYTAYVSERKLENGSVLYRVRVGPELLRSKANELQKRLNKDLGIQGLVMRY